MRDINIAGRDVNVNNISGKNKRHWTTRLISWFFKHLVVTLIVATVGGLVVAFVTYKMGW